MGTSKRINEWLSNNYVLAIYALISIGGILMFLFIAPIKGISILQWINMENNSDWTMLDYFRSILYDQDLKEVYSIHALYPPLAVLSYHYITMMTSLTGINDYSADMAEIVSTLPYQMMVYIVYMSIGMALIFFAISHLDISRAKKYVISVGALLSAPMAAGALERGNCVIYAVAFSLLALVWKDSKSKVKREMALVLIALSAGIKLYPAVMGVLYIKEKRFSECIRLILYGLVAIFVPFVFVGGMGSLKLFIEALLTRTTVIGIGRIQCIQGLIITFLNDSNSASIGILYLVFTLFLVFLIFYSKEKVRTQVYCAAFMAFVPTNAYRFTLLFFLLAVFALFKESPENRIDATVTSILLGSIFTIPTLWGLITGFELNYGFYTLTYVEVAIYAPAYVLLLYCIFRDIMEHFGNAKYRIN